MRRLLATFALFSTAAALITGCGSGAAPTATARVAATVDGAPISMDAFTTLSSTLRSRVERQTGASLDPHTRAGARRLTQVQASALRELVAAAVVEQLARAHHLTVADADVDAATTRLASALGGEDRLSLRLDDEGLSQADARHAIRLVLLEQRLRAADPAGYDKTYAAALRNATVVAYAPPCQASHVYPACLGG